MKDIAQKIIEIIKKNFPNGVRADFIDANKIARLYAANYHEEISRAQILEIICKSGIENGGRFYFISENDVEIILTALSAIFEIIRRFIILRCTKSTQTFLRGLKFFLRIF